MYSPKEKEKEKGKKKKKKEVGGMEYQVIAYVGSMV